jgi:hypothetical protein
MIELGPVRQPFRIDHCHSSAEMHAARQRIRVPHRLTTTRPATQLISAISRTMGKNEISGSISLATFDPVTAVQSVESDQRPCECGCGEPTTDGDLFRRGHLR